MNTLRLLVCLLVALIAFSSCASRYRSIRASELPYPQQLTSNDPVQVGYRYNVLAEAGNKKYMRKERKADIKLVAVQITNTTDRTLIFGKDVQLYAGEKLATPLTYTRTYNKIKQKSMLYLLYLPLTRLNYSVQTTDAYGTTRERFYPVGLILGPAIALGNLFYANASNKKLLNDLKAYKLDNKEIKPGETVYGLVGLRGNISGTLTAKLVESGIPVNDEYFIEDFDIRSKRNN